MIGLEYILSLYNVQHVELAQRLGIRKQNINMWIKGKQNIPKKYLPVLEEIFGTEKSYFAKELTDIEKLEIQKEKLKKDLKPVIKEYDYSYSGEEIPEIKERPLYDKEEINTIEREIEKAKLVSRFKNSLDITDKTPYMDTYRLIIELLEKSQHEVIFHKTIEALSHYLEILPGKISSDKEQEEFETEIFEVFDNNNY